MRCFSHPDQDAVGICKSCQKGVCTACAVDLGKGLACRTTCEADVRALISLIDASMRISPMGTKVWLGHRTNMLWTAAMCIVLGVIFTTWAALHDPPLVAVVAMGVVFVCWGLVQLIQALRLQQPSGDTPT